MVVLAGSEQSPPQFLRAVSLLQEGNSLFEMWCQKQLQNASRLLLLWNNGLGNVLTYWVVLINSSWKFVRHKIRHRHFDQRAYSLTLSFSTFCFSFHATHDRWHSYSWRITLGTLRVIPNATRVSESDTVPGITLNPILYVKKKKKSRNHANFRTFTSINNTLQQTGEQWLLRGDT